MFITSTESSKLVGDYVDPLAGRVTFADYVAGWLARKHATVKPTTGEMYAAHVRKHLVPAFGRLQLRAISREEVKAFAHQLARVVAPTTARAIVFTLAAVLREAVDDGRIAQNPAERIKVGEKTERSVDPMHIAGVAAKVPAIAEAMPPRWRAAVLLMASTGLRLGECCGLTVDRVDWLRRAMRVDRQIVKAVGITGFSSPKTRAGIRTVPLPKTVTDMLAAHLAEFGPGESGLIFTSSTGNSISRSNWASAYRAACAVAGLEGRTRTHDLRHVAASSLIASGLSVAAVQATLGHATAAETLTIYTHLWPTDEDRTREAIERASAGWLAAEI
jgi:integrase